MRVRRVVTENNNEGRSVVKWDTEIEGQPGRAGFENIPLWATDQLPPRLSEDDPNTWDLGTSLANGSVFRFCRYEPGVEARWHRTDSLDYAIVVSGEMWMQLDEEEVHLRAGDVIVQRSTIHNWVNRGTEPCVMAYVLIATEGAESTGWS